MDARVRQFRRRRRSGKCPKDVRTLAVGYARERVAEGESAKTAARELDLGCSTLERWLRDSSSTFGPIELVPSSRAVASFEGGSGGAVLVTRQGHRVIGLDLDGLAQVLRVLG
jgi:hypothetical protein